MSQCKSSVILRFKKKEFSFPWSLLQDKKSAYPLIMLFEIVPEGRKPG